VNRYIQYVLNLILVYVLVGVGFNIVIGNLGQLAFANVALFGLGAYASGILVVHAGWPWWTTIVPSRSPSARPDIPRAVARRLRERRPQASCARRSIARLRPPCCAIGRLTATA